MLWVSMLLCATEDHVQIYLAHLSLRLPGLLLQQPLGFRMHAGELLGDRVLRPVFLLRQPLDPPDIGKKLADLYLINKYQI